MLKTLKFFIFIGGLAIVFLGLVLMLLEGESQYDSKNLSQVVLFLNFFVGTLVMVYLGRKKRAEK